MKFYTGYDAYKVVTFTIADNTVSHYVYNDHFLALTKDGTLYVYDKHGKQMLTNQTDICFINTYGDLLFIKNDGSIISDINEDTYEGTVIGKIPGAVSGCKCYSTVIVTDKGELYFRDREGGSPFKFRDTEQLDGWIKINDVKEVTKAVIAGDSASTALFILNNKGEVYCCSDYSSYGGDTLMKLSEDYIITDISQCCDTFFLLDDQGNLYEFGNDIRKQYWHLDQITKLERFKNIEKLTTSFGQGTVITANQQVFVWQKKKVFFGKACEWELRFGELLEQGWDEIVPASEDYIYVIKDRVASRIPTHTICDELESW